MEILRQILGWSMEASSPEESVFLYTFEAGPFTSWVVILGDEPIDLAFKWAWKEPDVGEPIPWKPDKTLFSLRGCPTGARGLWLIFWWSQQPLKRSFLKRVYLSIPVTWSLGPWIDLGRAHMSPQLSSWQHWTIWHTSQNWKETWAKSYACPFWGPYL